MQTKIYKQHFLNALICPTMAWHSWREATSSEPSPGQLLRMKEGNRIGQIARRQFPNGVLVQERSSAAAVKTTLALMDDPAVDAIFEATFRCRYLIAKADILVRMRQGWQLIEVKSGVNENSEHLRDIAYTAYLMSTAGKTPVKACLQLLNREYRLGMAETDLLAPQMDRTEEVMEYVEQYSTRAPLIEEIILGDTPPPGQLIPECKNCPYFEESCLGKGVDYHVIHLPNKPKGMLADLASKNIHRIADIPDDYPLKPIHGLIRRSVQQGKPIYDRNALQSRLQEIEWPVAYLDFESIQTAIPRYPSVAPYEQFVTQFSLHLCDKPGQIVRHSEFLADPGDECQKDLILTLLQSVQDARTVMVYSSFEKTMLSKLAQSHAQYEEGITNVIGKLYDLLTVMKPKVYYHPDLHGSTSIKAVLPVLIPGNSYEGLDIRSGEEAIAMFVRMIDGQCTPEEAAVIRQNLLAYCKLDTFAMVSLHQALDELAAA